MGKEGDGSRGGSSRHPRRGASGDRGSGGKSLRFHCGRERGEGGDGLEGKELTSGPRLSARGSEREGRGVAGWATAQEGEKEGGRGNWAKRPKGEE